MPFIFYFFFFVFAFGGCEAPPKPPPVIDPIAEKDVGREIIKQTVEVGPETKQSKEALASRRTLLDERLQAKPGEVSGEHGNGSYPIDLVFQDVDVRKVVEAFAALTNANILVGDEVAGTITARIHTEPWDQALQALLDMKNLASTVNAKTGLMSIRGRTELTQTENYQKQREEAMKNARARDAAFRPIRSEIFRLYYADPKKIKEQLEEIFQGKDPAEQKVQISIVNRLRALVVKASDKDISFVDKYVEQVDVATKQVLIEAFIVEASNKFEQELGTRFGLSFGGQGGGQLKPLQDIAIGGIAGGPAAPGVAIGEMLGDTIPATIPGAAPGSISNLPAAAATSGIGFLQSGTTADLKLELTAMEAENLGRIVSNPKVFTLDNQPAIIQQGTQIPYQTISAQGTQTQFVDATLKLQVTPSIVGDGNIVLQLKINKDSPQASTAAQPPINKMEINTQLLMSNGQIAVIGGVFTENMVNSISKVPFLGDLPMIGWLFRNERDSDDRKQIFIFVAPQII